MNMLNANFDNIETGLQKLKDAVSLRNKMGGALYYNTLNDDCNEIASKLRNMGADADEITAILNG